MEDVLLEADPESPDELLSNYEQEMNVYSILKDKEGHILFQSKPDKMCIRDRI